ncbi:MAG: cation transporting ATPase C-terminal domain-containing protein [Polyangiaceae bacterium]|nr:cation transporting ATPase C-terminal domain-containing protein [Polyangiaceae bacterium]
MVVIAGILFQDFYLLDYRSPRDTTFQIGVVDNPAVFLCIGVTLALHAAFVDALPMQRVFGSAPLDASELRVTALAGVVTLPVISLEKRLVRRWDARKAAQGATGGPATAKAP